LEAETVINNGAIDRAEFPKPDLGADLMTCGRMSVISFVKE
jgi:hypothetical protein